MVYISKLQQDTLLLVDGMINEKKKHNEILELLYSNGYEMRIPKNKNGSLSKTKIDLFKNNENSFVTLLKLKNGLVSWETIRLS